MKKNQSLLEELFIKKGYGKLNILGCYKHTFVPKRSRMPEFLLPNIGYGLDDAGNFSVSLSICLYSNKDIMHYLFGYPLGSFGVEGIGLSWEFVKGDRVVHTFEYQYMNDKFNVSFKLSEFDKFYKSFIRFEQMSEDRYSDLDNILTDQDKYLELAKELNRKYGVFREKEANFYRFRLDRVALYSFFGDKDSAIQELEGFIEQNSNYCDHKLKRCMEFLDCLKKGTDLKCISKPNNAESIMNIDDENIYIFLNRKTTKDRDVLEYFGGADRFDRPKNISVDEFKNSDGDIAICRIGKWTILKISFQLIADYNQKEMGRLFSELSEKYNRAAILVNQDTSNTFGFEVYKKGELIRRWMAGDGEVLENFGKPITGERGNFKDELKRNQDVASVKKFMESLLKLNQVDFEKAKCVVYDLK